jgi:phage gp46-like protein
MSFQVLHVGDRGDASPTGWDFLYSAASGVWDFAAAGLDAPGNAGGLSARYPIETAIAIQILTEARARDEDRVPAEVTDRRGWAGDLYGLDEERGEGELGSRLWTLQHWPRTEATLRRAEALAVEALDTLRRQGVAARIIAAAEWAGADRLDLGITVTSPAGGSYTRRFAILWEVVGGAQHSLTR